MLKVSLKYAQGEKHKEALKKTIEQLQQKLNRNRA